LNRKEGKDMFRFGIVLFKFNAEAPKKPKTCIKKGRGMRRRSW
jgi:hypothetical protein